MSVYQQHCVEIVHPDTESLTAALAQRVLQQLRAALHAGREASLVVSGGRSPVALFQQLSAAPLDWRHVWITLADERWVPADDDSSNARLVRAHLLQNKASAARFVGLKNAAWTPAEGVAGCWSALAPVPRPFDVVVLGMGEDGHFASLFPDSPGLQQALDPALPATCVAMTAPVEPQPRISLNLAALLDARLLLLPVSGEAKVRVLQRARETGPVTALPVRALLQQRQTPLEIHRFP